MAIQKVIKIDVDTLKAEGGLDNIDQIVKKLDGDVSDLGNNADDSLKKISKSVENTEKSTKSLAEGFKGIGIAIKAMGIGLVISALNTLKDVFMSNQKVANAFNIALGAITNVFQQITNVVVSVVDKVSKSTKGFEGLSKVIMGLITLALTPLKATFYSLVLAIDEIRLAWEDSIFGDKNQTKINELNKRIGNTKGILKEISDDAIKSGKQVVNNFGKAVNEVGSVVSGVVDGMSEVSISAAIEQSKALVNLQNNAKLAEAEQAKLVEKYDRQAEKLRQIRDDDRNAIEDRIKANSQLGKVLSAQEKAMLAQADAQISAARATLQQNNSIENQVELINAQANREGVLAQIEGFRSEQKMNEVSLNKELIDLANTRKETETTLAVNQKKFDTERIKSEHDKLVAQKSALEEEKRIELERLQNVINSHKKGTQARVDAEKEYALKKQEVENAITLKQDEIDAFRVNKSIEFQKKIVDNEQLGFQTRLNSLLQQDAIIREATTISEEEKTRMLQENALIRMAIDEQEYQNKKSLAFQSVEVLSQVFQENKGIMMALFVLQKAMAIGDIVRTAAKSIAQQRAFTDTANAEAQIYPFPANLAKIASNEASFIKGATFTKISAGVGIASILAQAFGQIKGMSGISSIGGGAGGSAQPATPSPQFNIVGNTGVNQIAQTIAGQQPVKAYVVAKEVTTQQELDRNKITATRI